jgi:hypothetical protein
MPRVSRSDLVARAGLFILSLALVACGSAAKSTGGPGATGEANQSPALTAGPVGAGHGALPGVEGFAYRDQPGIVPGFVAGAEESLEGAAEVRIVQASVASRDQDEVAIIAFSFPGATDAQAVDYMARILDGMEDGFQAPAQRGLDGEGYVMNFSGQTVVVAPWGHTEDSQLVFLFFHGPSEPTQQLAAAILNQLD